MSYLIKMVGVPRGAFPVLTVGDASNQQRNFDWSVEHEAYCWAPPDDKAAFDVISLNWTMLKFPWRFAPVGAAWGVAAQKQAPANAVSTATIPPYLKPELYAAYPLDDLKMLAANDALPLEGDVSDRDNVMRQLHAYYQGRAWGIEDVKRSRAKVAEMESKLKELTPKPEAPKMTPAERMAKARAAKKAKSVEPVTA